MALRAGPSEGDGRSGAGARHRRAHLHAALALHLSDEFEIALRPRAAYARIAAPRASYLLFYVLLVSSTIAVAGAVSATGRITLSLFASLAAVWSFVPAVQIVTGALSIAGAPAARASRAGMLSLLMMGHAPWTLWIATAAVLSGVFGYSGYLAALALTVLPGLATLRILYAFYLEVPRFARAQALRRLLLHQALTWLIVAAYLEKAVDLRARLGL